MKPKNKYIFYYTKEDYDNQYGCDIFAYSMKQAEFLFYRRHKKQIDNINIFKVETFNNFLSGVK